ncbi:MAG: pilus assembly protein PilM [Tissierellia bacterium]|nr:pilus assembly protein PilM [Tissierellia bacterium]
MRIFTRKNVLSFDFTNTEIKVVEGKYSRKGLVIDKSISVPVARDIYWDGIIHDMEHITYLLGQALNSNNMALGEAYGVINTTEILTRGIMIPKVEDNEIDSIIHYQLEDYIPINAEDYVVNHLKLGPIMDEGIEKINLMLVCVPKSIVESHLSLIKKLKLKPMVLDYSGNAIRKLLMINQQINGSNEITGSIAAIGFGYESSIINIIDGDLLKVSRLVDIGWKYLIESLSHVFPGLNENEIKEKINALTSIDEDYESNTDEYKVINGVKTYINSVFPNIDMIFRYYSAGQVGNDVDYIVLLDGLSNIDGIEKMCTNFFNKPTIRMKSLNRVKFDGDLSKYANAIGGLIRLGEVKK